MKTIVFLAKHIFWLRKNSGVLFWLPIKALRQQGRALPIFR